MERSISIERHVKADFDAAAEVLRTEAAELVCDDPDAMTLTVHADVAGFDVSRDVVVTLGEPEDVDVHAVVVPLAWEAAEHPKRFPTVEGVLELTAVSHHPTLSQLAFVGRVTPPLGALGTVGDAAGGRAIADGVLERVLEKIEQRLVNAVARKAADDAEALGPTHASKPRVVLPD